MSLQGFAVAPTDESSERNTLREPLRAIAWWQLADAHFAFDSSLLLPTMTKDLAVLITMIRANPESPITIFGHADPTGQEGYNKILSGRRATALFGFLTRNVELWVRLYDNPVGRDDWKKHELAAQVMRERLGVTAGSGGSIRSLMKQYMDAVCVDAERNAFSVSPTAFLGKGKDPGGKAAYQGCGEFNPLVLVSAEDQARFASPGAKEERDEANAPNRRVAVFLLPKGFEVPSEKWPCPRASEGIGGCQKRFWSDAPVRRQLTASRRERPADATTFQCRFYDRLATEISGGHQVGLRWVVPSPKAAAPPEFALHGPSGAEFARLGAKATMPDPLGGVYHVFEAAVGLDTALVAGQLKSAATGRSALVSTSLIPVLTETATAESAAAAARRMESMAIGVKKAPAPIASFEPDPSYPELPDLPTDLPGELVDRDQTFDPLA